jgi:sarcosine oxidase
LAVDSYEVIVAGLGAMGSASAYHLAAAGRRVLGLDRFHPPHDQGSSHGLSRIIREAYFEHPAYVPLVQRAYTLWSRLEELSGQKLLLPTGGLMIGPPDGALVKGARSSAEQHRLEHQVLGTGELQSRYPMFQPEPGAVAVWEPRAGMLFPEAAIKAHLDLAAQHGATLQFDEPVLSWEADGDGIRVVTAKSSYRAQRMIISAGAWLSTLVPELALPLSVERQVLFWFQPRAQAARFRPPECPIFIWQYGLREFFYGLPDVGDGFKVAIHHQGEVTSPDAARREVRPSEIESMRSLLRRFMPEADGPLKSTAVCLYTDTPDEHFIIDHHPRHPQVLIVSPCSGHGFKFSAAIGEVAAQRITGKTPAFDLSLFALKRLVR